MINPTCSSMQSLDWRGLCERRDHSLNHSTDWWQCDKQKTISIQHKNSRLSLGNNVACWDILWVCISALPTESSVGHVIGYRYIRRYCRLHPVFFQHNCNHQNVQLATQIDPFVESNDLFKSININSGIALCIFLYTLTDHVGGRKIKKKIRWCILWGRLTLKGLLVWSSPVYNQS